MAVSENQSRYSLNSLPGIRPDRTSNHWRAVNTSLGGRLSKRVTSSEVGGWLLSLSLLAAPSGSKGSTTAKPSAAHSEPAYNCHGSSGWMKTAMGLDLLLRMVSPTTSPTLELRE